MKKAANQPATLQTVVDRLDTILRLLLVNANLGETGSEQIQKLSTCGFTPAEIASLLDKKRVDVNSVLYQARRRSTTRGKTA